MRISHPKYIFVIGLLLGLVLVLAACGQTETPAPTEPPRPTAVITPVGTTPEATEATTGPAPAGEVQVPFLEQWTGSAHAQADAPAFTHWNEEDPKEIPQECAKCHSAPGFQDYTGADGSAFGSVEQPAAVGTVIDCVACHNDATVNLSMVIFPSGAQLTGLGGEAICATCHQGTASKTQVDEAVAAATDEDSVLPEQRFINIHYYAAAVTKYGTLVKGGYEYDGQSYDAQFNHVEGFSSCTDCHNSHTLQVDVQQCSGCHSGVATAEDLRNIRSFGSTQDYDGDGNTQEGVYFEIEGLRTLLLQAMQGYANDVAKSPITYSAEAYPYFFIDTNNNGQADEDEAAFPNAYKSWTPRLLKAAYNYQTSVKDPGGYAHGGKYIIELLYDSIANLNEKLATPVNLEAAHRTDAGHFAGSEEAFRHWDEEGEVETACVKCHSAEGLPMFLENGGSTVAVEPSNGFQCQSCHSDLSTFARYEVADVQFPSGAVVTFDSPDNNLCLECHQGRESTVSINAAIKDLSPDQPNEKLRFRNVHYFAAGATLFGSDVQGAYQFPNQTYNGQFAHVESFNTCTECHDAHALTVNTQSCEGCHNTADPKAIRGQSDTTDYDGDGNTTEGVAGEIETMQEQLYAALQKYAADTLKTPLVYNPARYPYFFADANGNGQIDEGEGAYAAWSPKLLQSAYNYQYVQKDPGAFAHNGKYILQVLYDSIKNVGGSVSGLTRP